MLPWVSRLHSAPLLRTIKKSDFPAGSSIKVSSRWMWDSPAVTVPCEMGKGRSFLCLTVSSILLAEIRREGWEVLLGLGQQRELT